MSIHWEGKISQDNNGQAPMFTGNLIDSLMETVWTFPANAPILRYLDRKIADLDIEVIKVTSIKLALNNLDPFIWAPACHQMYKKAGL